MKEAKSAFEGVGEIEKVFANSICSNYLRSGIIPDWFDPNQKPAKARNIQGRYRNCTKKKSSKSLFSSLKRGYPGQYV